MFYVRNVMCVFILNHDQKAHDLLTDFKGNQQKPQLPIRYIQPI